MKHLVLPLLFLTTPAIAAEPIEVEAIVTLRNRCGGKAIKADHWNTVLAFVGWEKEDFSDEDFVLIMISLWPERADDITKLVAKCRTERARSKA